MNHYVANLRNLLKQDATLERQSGAEAYLRNQFKCLGLDTITRRTIFKKYVTGNNRPLYKSMPALVVEMWSLERELQYCAVELAALYKKEWKQNFIETIEACIVSDSWWDTVDHIASEWAGPYFKIFQSQIKPVTGKWNRSKNIWLQRSSIMFQKKYRTETDTALLSKYILHCAGSNEFFIQKAIGWALREYAKTNPAWVKAFVNENKLKPLSSREAIKNI